MCRYVLAGLQKWKAFPPPVVQTAGKSQLLNVESSVSDVMTEDSACGKQLSTLLARNNWKPERVDVSCRRETPFFFCVGVFFLGYWLLGMSFLMSTLGYTWDVISPTFDIKVRSHVEYFGMAGPSRR